MTAPRQLPSIGRLGPEHSAAMVQSLARAFQDDPAMGWIMPDAATRARRLPLLFKALVAEELKLGWTMASPGAEAVTLWRRSSRVHMGLFQMLRALPTYTRALGTSLPRGLIVSQAIERHHPRGGDYHYLHYAGVDPAFQGRGWGGAAIRAGQARAAAQGRPVYLETATPENVGLYQRLGFAVTQEWDVPGGGPHFWSMWWEPGAP